MQPRAENIVLGFSVKLDFVNGSVSKIGSKCSQRKPNQPNKIPAIRLAAHFHNISRPPSAHLRFRSDERRYAFPGVSLGGARWLDGANTTAMLGAQEFAPLVGTLAFPVGEGGSDAGFFLGPRGS